MACQWYPHGKYHVLHGDCPFDSPHFFHGLLLWEGGVFNPAHNYVSDVIAGSLEMSGGGYVRKMADTKTLTIVGSNVIFTSDPMTFLTLPIGHTAVALVIYCDLGGDPQNPVLGFYDGGGYPNDLPKATTGGDLVCSPHAVDGWFKM